jgi:hypothetical protein
MVQIRTSDCPDTLAALSQRVIDHGYRNAMGRSAYRLPLL